MGKFKLKMSLNLEIEGSREDIPVITNAIGKQIGGMLEPTNQIIEGETIVDTPKQLPSGTNKSRKRRLSGGAAKRETASTPAFTHDPIKWGTPKQDWTVADKAIWVLRVMRDSTSEELTPGSIATIFNDNFKEAGRINASNVSRDLRKQRVNVSENKSNDPVTFHLTQKGIDYADQLVAKAKG
jgi:hypothetical protein